MFDRAALPRVAPFLAYLFFIFVADMLGRSGFMPEQLRWLYALKIAVVLGLGLDARSIAAAVATGTVVFLLWINLDANWMSLGQAEGFDPRSEGRTQWSLVLLRIAGAALVVPVMEELFWRSFLLRWIDAANFLARVPAQASARAFLVTMVLFGIEHNLWLAGMVAGAAYTILYMRSNSLWSPILAHGVTNGVLGCWIISGGHWNYW